MVDTNFLKYGKNLQQNNNWTFTTFTWYYWLYVSTMTLGCNIYLFNVTLNRFFINGIKALEIF